MARTLQHILKLTSLTFALFLAAGVVLAYTGNHSFTNTYTTSSNGHTFDSDFVSTPSSSFPYNGQGNYDGSLVDMKGVYTLYAVDGTVLATPEVYCLSLKGTINKRGKGQVAATVYSDTSCTTVSATENYQVISYTEDSTGNFTLKTKDNSGVRYTTVGIHSFTP